MDLGLKGKTALVLGAGGGLGGAIAATLAREGARVAIGDIDTSALERTAKEVSQVGSEALSLAWDLGDLAEIEQHVGAIEARFGPVDVLINNTGAHRRPLLLVKMLPSGTRASRPWCCPS